MVTAEDDVDLRLLSAELEAENRPTADQHALEVTVLWGDTVVDSSLTSRPRAIRVGPVAGPDTDLAVQGVLPVERWTVAVNEGQEATVVVPAHATAALRGADGRVQREIPLAAADAPFPAGVYTLRFGERLAFKVGTLTFVAEYVRGDGVLGPAKVMDRAFPFVFALSALLHVFFVLATFFVPGPKQTPVEDIVRNRNRFAEMRLKLSQEKRTSRQDLSGKSGGRARGDEGRFGRRDRPRLDRAPSKPGAPTVDAEKRERDRRIAMNSGLLKGLRGRGAVSNVLGPGGLGTGINDAMGGLKGRSLGDAGGAGGLGSRGTGAGGGGTSLGIGGLGGGSGRGTGGDGNIDLGGRGKGRTRIIPGRTVVKGSLSREEIARVIRQNFPRFRYCYEKQLNADPDLGGKVSVHFTIAPTGSVARSSVRETSMDNQVVERCVAGVMKSLQFPRPRGGGIVVVTYPFVFSST
ncbi:MAG: AgmX/PglI C-terminal domain-containing protein [Myxococcota bacterium]